MYAGKDEESDQDDIVFLSINTYWETVTQHLPQLPATMQWITVVDTFRTHSVLEIPAKVQNNTVMLSPRSVQIFTAVYI